MPYNCHSVKCASSLNVLTLCKIYQYHSHHWTFLKNSKCRLDLFIANIIAQHLFLYKCIGHYQKPENKGWDNSSCMTINKSQTVFSDILKTGSILCTMHRVNFFRVCIWVSPQTFVFISFFTDKTWLFCYQYFEKYFSCEIFQTPNFSSL